MGLLRHFCNLIVECTGHHDCAGNAYCIDGKCKSEKGKCDIDGNNSPTYFKCYISYITIIFLHNDLFVEKFVTTPIGQMCSDIEEPEITDKNVCKEAQKWLQVYEFIDKSSHPSPLLPSGCIYWGSNPERVIWNPIETGTPHEAMNAICLNSGKYILVYHALS